ncbi:MAG: hypothetical protein A3F11_01180 [Gammaproteobacteria bacterium RIFCSPHIGHO2_12_FULL_37_14]|nr:MAG: hypothetical protein A3F11_01180 [Gammaproteobacteria bacterium RIFCSPHIGHO2_12_FULL_37_14]
MINVGGWSLILFSILYVALTLVIDHIVQSQTMLYSLEEHRLFKVVAGSYGVRFFLTIYALLPLLLIPGAVATYYTFIEKHEANMRVGMYFATAGVIALCISLLMLPSINWHLLSHVDGMPVEIKASTIITIQALHSYFGIYVGDILGLGCLLVWFFITSLVMMRSGVVPRLLGVIEVIIAICATLLLMFRYLEETQLIYTNIQAPGFIALWIFLCGIGLLSLRNR